MIGLLDVLLGVAAFVGHFALAVFAFNRLHAQPWPRWIIKLLDRVIVLGAAALATFWAILAYRWGVFALDPRTGLVLYGPALWYAAACWFSAALVLPMWLIPKLLQRVPAAQLSNDSELIDIRKRLGSAPVASREARFFSRFPGNQAFQFHIHRKELHLPQLPKELDALTIAHLSDLHMTGDYTPDFYREVVRETNALGADLIVVTGDILEVESCLAWGPALLGGLKSREGCYFILGNHEMRLKDAKVLRSALTAEGWIDLGSRCEQVTIRGVEVLMAGTEVPWFGHVPRIPDAAEAALRILLSHSPDELPWAKRYGFDLMLAGHNHGGQIRLPWLGALISPSRYGWRYAGGVYYEAPTVLHVTRGISGDHPIRINCPPEIALLRLVG